MAKGNLSLRQRMAICFFAGVIGGLAVVLFSHLLFSLGISQQLNVKAPASLNPPEVYRPLFWGGLWGLPFGLIVKTVWDRLYAFGLMYFLAPVIALYVFFAPMRGLGLFGLEQGPLFGIYLLVVNVPYGIVTAVAARLIIGSRP